MRPAVRWLLIASVLSVPFTVTHVVEDFSVGIHQRFGLSLLLAAFLTSLGYTAQAAGAALSARDRQVGHWLNLVVASVWLLGAVLDHLAEPLLIPTDQYRAGAISKSLGIGSVLTATVWAVAAGLALRRSGQKSAS